MNRYLICFLTLMLMVLTAAHWPASSADRSFSNADLDRYKGETEGVIIPETISPAPSKKEKPAKKVSEEKSKQYWCSRGSSQRVKVDRAKAKVEDAERKIADMDAQPRKKKSRSIAEKKVREAKKELYRAEQELNDLEQKAHRQSIPPGWLRCQSGY